jgi:chromosome segregation ATPase
MMGNADESCSAAGSNKSYETMATELNQALDSYYQTWNQIREQCRKYTEEIIALNHMYESESLNLDQIPADELWENSFLPQMKALEDAQSKLDENIKELEAEKVKVCMSGNLNYRNSVI